MKRAMRGGIIVQLFVEHDTSEKFVGYYMELLNPVTFQRCWRYTSGWEDIVMYDHVRWDSKDRGYLSRANQYIHQNIGPCIPSAHPLPVVQ